MDFKFSAVSLNRLKGIDEELQNVCYRALKITSIDFGIPPHGGFRNEVEQNMLHMRGDSPYCDGYINKSHHQTGKAVDIFAYVDSKASWEPEHLTIIAAAMLQAASELGVKLKWGGHFKSGWDKPHFQMDK